MNDMFGYVIGILGFLFGILVFTYDNLEYKGYSSAHSCSGDCYIKYVEEHGTSVEIEQRKKEIAKTDEFSSIRGLWSGCAACHGQDGQGMGVFPKLAGQTSDYISDRLYAYKNREQIGAMSSTMWAQAGMLSDQDIKLISKFIEEGIN
jgi:cytochrome c553|tara:strand:- start:45 stop:488 length:444 start_codon:yes stop_codon:yes gene_type:complete